VTTAFALGSHDLALQLHELLRDLDPARWRDELESAFRERLRRIEQSLNELAEHSPLTEARGMVRERLPHAAHGPAGSSVRNAPQGRRFEVRGLRPEDARERLRQRLVELKALMLEHAPRAQRDARDVRAEWMAFRERMQPAYEALAAHLRSRDLELPRLRPTNRARSGLHLMSGLVALAAIQALSQSWSLVLGLACSWAAFVWALEAGRRRWPRVNRACMRFLGPFAHPHEHHRVNSATWYATAMLGLALTWSPLLASLAVVVLGAGDPAAAAVGRRWGRRRLINGRSLEGSLSMWAASAVAGTLTLGLLHGGTLGWAAAAVVAISAGLVGAVAELVAKGLDDNLLIPLAAAAGGAVALWSLGIPPA
jgi:dolichol kinase